MAALRLARHSLFPYHNGRNGLTYLLHLALAGLHTGMHKVNGKHRSDRRTERAIELWEPSRYVSVTAVLERDINVV